MFVELPAFGVVLDLSSWIWFISLPLARAARVLFAGGGWVALAYIFFKKGLEGWVEYRQNKYTSSWQWVLLAVDVPPLLIQTPKAVEQIFAHLSGALSHINVQDKFWIGKTQKWFSLEIISIEGYIQFLIRAEAEFRDLTEAAIYAQYPEAEITEVEDYISRMPVRYPDSEYDIMGVEFKLAEADAYPIRTYPDFQYSLSKDVVFSDPMAAILENFSRITHGENFWMQIVIEPIDSQWKEAGIELAKKLMGGGGGREPSDSWLAKIAAVPKAIAKDIATHGFLVEAGEHEREVEDGGELTPGMKTTVEIIEEKISKIGFKSKARVLYAARKNVFSPGRCVEGFVGAISQFHYLNRNAIVPFMATHAHYDPKHKKSYRLKNTFAKVYAKRKLKWKKCGGYILNIEELATIWHFPLPFVKTPQVQKAGYKRGEPPVNLPIETMENPLHRKLPKPAPPPPPPPPPAPEDLPYG